MHLRHLLGSILEEVFGRFVQAVSALWLEDTRELVGSVGVDVHALLAMPCGVDEERSMREEKG